jgi:hypothetical protein
MMRLTRARFIGLILPIALLGLALVVSLLVRHGSTVSSGTISGKIIDENQAAVRGARVYLASPGYGNITETRTNRLGNFTLTGLPDDRELILGVSYLEYGHFRFDGLRTREWHTLQIRPHGYELYGQPAPALSVEKWYNTDALALADLRGKVVLLDIGLHIDNYDDYNRTVLRVYDKYREKGLVVVGIHIHPSGNWPRQMTDDDVQDYLTSHAISFPVGLDQRHPHGIGTTYWAYRAHASPAKYLVDKKGILRVSPLDKDLDRWVAQLLTE